MSDSADDADDRVPRLVIFRWSKANAFADRALVGPVLPRQSLIDDGYIRRVFFIRIVEVPTGKQGDTHRTKVTGSDNGVLNRTAPVRQRAPE